jgi:hypothetical protein
MSNPEPPSAAPASERRTEQRPPAEVDIRELAERVYRLMLADARLELARRGRPPRRHTR